MQALSENEDHKPGSFRKTEYRGMRKSNQELVRLDE